MLDEEVTVAIEVISTKRGKCIRCRQPGRKRMVRAQRGRFIERMDAILCLRCAKTVAVNLKWTVVYAGRPAICEGLVELGMIAQERGR